MTKYKVQVKKANETTVREFEVEASSYTAAADYAERNLVAYWEIVGVIYPSDGTDKI